MGEGTRIKYSNSTNAYLNSTMKYQKSITGLFPHFSANICEVGNE